MEIQDLMEVLKIADAKTIGKVMAGWGRWKEGNSAVVNSHKKLKELSDLGKLEKVKKAFRVPGCRSEWKEHAQLTTHALAEILIKYPESIIYREPFIQEVSLRPDAICLLKNGNQGRCIILEITNHETQLYFDQKVHTWEHWDGANDYLSRQFGFLVPYYEIVKGGDLCRFF